MLPMMLMALITAAPILAGEAITPAEADRILAGTTVLLKIRPDTIPIGHANSGRVLLAKIQDSAYALPDKSLLMISSLAILRAREVLPVTEESWITSKHGSATISFKFLDARGKPDSFWGHLDTADIESIFVPDLAPASSPKIAPVAKTFIVAAAAVAGGIIGGVYGNANGGNGSTPGSAAFFMGLAGFSIGLLCGFEFVLSGG